ncbi:MAG: hydrogenase iron-sulfur subunit [Chloroflexi bacterium]|nr:hydrogenase iron-sulfur subunit [Chloroflexota bacterium]
MSDSVLVIGGGIAGIQASLDLAEAGAKVIMVEKQATIGGIMAVLDKNFPTLDCSICIEAPKMSEVDLHPNIEILSLAEVDSITGGPGIFEVKIRQKSRYVTDECTRCGDCTEVCPVVLPNEYDSGMAFRKAIYTPIPQSTPGPYRIDMDNCLNNPPNYIPCERCYQTCPPKAIDYLMKPETVHTRQVGAVIVAVGYDMLDPRKMKEYGYGSHPDILTAMEFERLINSAGPTGGEIIRPSDGKHPQNILFVLCVGSRDHRHHRYCSRFCCMYSIKHAYQALDHGVEHVTVLYMDIRAYGKGFDGFYQRTAEMGAKFLRGRPSRIMGHNGTIKVTYEDVENAARIQQDFDMVVLANAVTPQEGLAELAGRLGIEMDDDGFLKSVETLGGLVMTTRPGIYAAGCASGPKDIPDSVAEGSGAAALALSHLTSRSWPEPPEIEPRPDIATPRVGVFVCHCGSNIAGVVDVERVVEYSFTLPDVVHADHQMFSCAGNTQAEIEQAIIVHNINRVVIAACSPKTHEMIFKGVMTRAGLNPYLLVMSNIRNMDSWVHKHNKEAATIKAEDMIAMAVEHARLLEPLEIAHLPLTQSALVIGGGIAGMTAAATIARQGFETHLVERTGALGGLLNELDHLAPAGIPAKDLIEAKARDLVNTGVKVHMNTEVETIGGVVGNFHAKLTDGADLDVGAVIMATGAAAYTPTEFGYGNGQSQATCRKSQESNLQSPISNIQTITNLELEHLLAQDAPIAADRVTFIACVGSRQAYTEQGGSRKMGCSRYCCTSMISQALRLRQMGKKVRVVGKDIRTYSRQAEELYEEAMRAGVQFFRYDQDQPPQDVISVGQVDNLSHIEFYDHMLGADISIPTDLVVLVVGLTPTEDNLAGQLKLSRSEDGFYMELHPKLGPAETASQGIYLAGAAQGAKDVRESMAQAMAAAGKAGALISRDTIEKAPLTARLIPELCKGCMRCVRVCPYSAIEQIGEPGEIGSVRILEAACMGCGTCAAECNFEAIIMPYFTKQQIIAQVDAALAENPQEKCLVFTCNWCSYAGADLAGIEKRQYPPSSRVIRTMCSARFEEDFVARAFEKGAGAVLITGCRLTEYGSDCHYNYANKFTEKRFQRWVKKFQRQGIDPERLQLRWISAAEGKEFAEKLHEMDEVIRSYQLAANSEQ